jgi:hypothetical protein
MEHAFGRCGRARSVEKQKRIGRLHPRRGTKRRSVVDLREFDAAPFEHLLRLRQADREPRAAVAHERQHLGAAVRHVQRAHHGPQARDGEIADDEFGNVRKLHRDDVAARDAALLQSIRSAQDPVFQVLPGQNRVLESDGRRLRPLAHMAREPLRERVVRPPAARDVFVFHQCAFSLEVY